MGILAVDPGTKELGWCSMSTTIDGHPVVVGAGLLRAKNFSAMLEALPAFCAQWNIAELVVEMPKVYRRGEAKVDPADLILIAMVGGAVIGGVCHTKTWTPLPSDWKGQVPKDVMQKRLKKLLSKRELETVEQDLADVPRGVRHNVWDAIGIAMWKAKRYTR